MIQDILNWLFTNSHEHLLYANGWIAAAQIGGELLQGWLGYKGQKEANETNIKLGREQMDFQREMSNTAYTRAVADMKNAGLNPMLAYNQGGASSPAGSLPRVENTLGAGVNSARTGRNTMEALTAMAATRAQIEQTEAMTQRIKSETLDQGVTTAAKLAEIDNLRAQTQYTTGPRSAQTRADTSLSIARGDTEASENLRRQAEAQSAMDLYKEMKAKGGFAADVQRRKNESILSGLEIPKAKAEAEFWQGLGQYNPYLKSILEMLAGATSAKRAVDMGRKLNPKGK